MLVILNAGKISDLHLETTFNYRVVPVHELLQIFREINKLYKYQNERQEEAYDAIGLTGGTSAV